MKNTSTRFALVMNSICVWLALVICFNAPDAWGQGKGPDKNKFKGLYKLIKKVRGGKPSREQVRNGSFNFKSSRLKDNPNGRLDITAGLKNPTSLQFGPDGKLYVAQQNGLIKVLTIVKNAPNDYSIASQETISLINTIPNHNDDGSLAPSVTTRQVTGLLVTGTATNPILYVSSSDSRIGGPEGDLNLDTNSGIVSKLTKTPTGWQKVDLVRGLPRSEENHATNGLQLDGNKLYLVVGGHTNAGSPSTNFAYTPEYALAACVLSIDLAVIEALPTRGSGNTAYKYDLPTLDDPNRAGNPDANDPFGGNDGLNQAKLVAGGPVQVFATGFRNAYDLVITRSRKMYVTDNGANPGWGGHPASEGVGTATNNYVTGEPGSTGSGPNDPKVNNLDNFHYVGDLRTYVPGSFYGGHPHPIRANPAGAGLYTHNGTSGVWRTSKTGSNPLPSDWPPVPVNMAHPIEGDFQNPGEKDNALITYTVSTNGIVEYTASGFNNGLKGHLLVASFDGTIQKITLNASGTGVTNSLGAKKKNLDLPFASNFGSQPLDITAQGDNDIFPGTVWVVCYLQNQIYVFEPEAAGGGCSAAYSTAFDDDGDGYSNADEIDNASNPCSASSRPGDADGDKVSDLNDPDDDNDGLADEVDYFALDASNGMTTTLPLEYNLFNNDPGTGLFGLGFTGLMLPMQTGIDYLDLFDEQNLVAGGAVGAFSVVEATPGDPYQAVNTQENGFQFGINTNSTPGPFRVQTRLLGPFFNNRTPQYHQSQGLYIGVGDQDNYLKVALAADGGTGGIEVVYENNGVASSITYTLPGGLPTGSLDLYLSVNKATGKVQPRYAKDGGALVDLGPSITVGGTLLQAIQGGRALAVGIVSTSLNSTPFTATWDFIRVTPEAAVANTAPVLASIGGKTATVGQALTFTAQATDKDLPAQTLTYSVSGPAGVSINASTGAFSWTPTTTGTFSLTVKVTDNGSPALSAQEVISVTVNATSSTGPAVVSVSLMNATTDQEIRVLTNGDQINLAAFTSRNVNLRANTSPTTVGSVKMVLSGRQNRTQIETGAPYSLFGDSNGDYNNWIPPVGSYTLKVTSYTGAGATGTAGTPLTISFTVVEQAPQATNTAPVLTGIGSKTATVGQPLSFTAQATDSDVPAQTLTYSVSGAAGASINASTGAFSWTPTTTGTFSLTVKVTDNGTPVLSAQEVISIKVNAAPVAQQTLVSFSLMNATTDQEIRVLSNGEQINLATLGTRNINIRANTNPATVGSVKMVLGGKQSRTQTDNGVPYALFGDSNGNFNNWTPALGSYTLTGTPYTASSAGGTAGVPLTISFTVVEQAPQATNTAPVLASIGGKTATVGQALTFTAQATDKDLPAQTLTYSVSGPAGVSINASTGAFSWTPTTTGTFSLTVKVADNGSPALSAQEVISVMVNASSSTGPAVVSVSLMNATSDQEIRVLSNGDQINLAAFTSRNVNLRANTSPTTVGSVKMVLSGRQNRTQIETGAPYSLFGDSNGDYNNWIPPVGSYTLKVTSYTGAGATGTAGTPLTINFTVVEQAPNGRVEADAEAEEMQVIYYPNPFQESFTLQVQGRNKGKLPVFIHDAYGRLLFMLEDLTQTEQLIQSGKQWPAGLYILQLGEGKRARRYRLVKLK